ncbi:MAG TPA: glycosyltransferase family 2 protein [Clostridia bacterium]|nr:glycosyltransferase family 2 protein [Clostridia bacterium]
MISLVIPVFNEEKSLDELYERVVKALKGRAFELIFVNDGSTDRSGQLIEKLRAKDKRISLVTFRQNQGKSRALMAGFRQSRGEIVVTLDADLQDQPEEIKKLLGKLEEGFDLVCGWKKKREDPWLNVLFSRFFNLVIGLTTKVSLHDINCGLKAFRRETVENLNLYGDLYRFIPVLAAKEGFRVSEVEVSHASRKYGTSKYGISKFIRGFFDLFTILFLTNFKTRPLHLFGFLGGAMITLGIIICLYLTILWFSGQAIGGRPLLFLGILLIISGVQLFTSGLLAELIFHTREKAN